VADVEKRLSENCDNRLVELYKWAASIFWPQRRAKASSRGTDKHELGSEEDRVAV
jgi:hypothetical protein